jgi:hypothetical protein
MPTEDTGCEPSAQENALQDEISKLRSAIMRTVIELDRFCATVREAQTAVRGMAGLRDGGESEPDDPGPLANSK